MKKAILFHGTGGNPELYWFPYMKRELEKRGYAVQVPAFPHSESPNLTEYLSIALKDFTYDEETTLIGHSSGTGLILSVLENIDTKIHQAIMVAGFFEPLDPPNPEPMVQGEYNWEKIRSNCGKFAVLNSDNDPWKCTDVVGRKLAAHVGGEFVLMKGQGHMGSQTYQQPYREFPLLLELIE